MYEHVRSRVK